MLVHPWGTSATDEAGECRRCLASTGHYVRAVASSVLEDLPLVATSDAHGIPRTWAELPDVGARGDGDLICEDLTVTMHLPLGLESAAVSLTGLPRISLKLIDDQGDGHSDRQGNRSLEAAISASAGT